ncbi:MAG TPA: 5-oxoprolinase subunit PxpA [Burkholderiaceae bacterium]|nr:5-oxoprolinase subunit PxpA [Burkholderiaceae bacterium]
MAWTIDLNCDMGESFGAWTMGNDAAVLPYVTSANIACGFHAGDPGTMRQTVKAALEHGVAIGAHPGLPDLVGFGRRTMDISPADVYDLVVVQVGALAAVAATQGGRLHHVKAHGALYNMAASRPDIANAIACAVRDIDPELVLFALANSAQVQAGLDAGLTVAQEVFADRSYQSNGLLTPRSQEGAMITDIDKATAQVLKMVKQASVTSLDGQTVSLTADTLCLHGDQPDAARFARHIRDVLEGEGVTVAPVSAARGDAGE